MNRNLTAESPVTIQPSRIIGRIKGGAEGPVILVFSGMHGNEPAGVEAVENVFSILKGIDGFKGKFIGVRANLRALFEGVRFVDEDMNRIWFPSIIDKIRRCPAEDLESSERIEIKQLLELIDREIPMKSGHPVIFVDLHSFSAQGSMFAITAPKETHMNILSSLHVPVIFGIEEALQGTALRYFQDLDFISFALEGGNHQNSLTVYNKTAAMMLLLSRTGAVDKLEIPGYREYERHLLHQNDSLPSKGELVYQHIIEDGDDFEMQPGYKNFQPVKEGEWLANDKNGRIRAQSDGYILMPLYQEQGDDGFFIVREQHN